MPRSEAIAVLSATLALLACGAAEQPSATDPSEETVSQGTDPPGAENGDQVTPPLVQDKGVIQPPPTGDEDIYTQAPDPHAGHDEEVIPPPQQ